MLTRGESLTQRRGERGDKTNQLVCKADSAGLSLIETLFAQCAISMACDPARWKSQAKNAKSLRDYPVRGCNHHLDISLFTNYQVGKQKIRGDYFSTTISNRCVNTAVSLNITLTPQYFVSLSSIARATDSGFTAPYTRNTMSMSV